MSFFRRMFSSGQPKDQTEPVPGSTKLSEEHLKAEGGKKDEPVDEVRRSTFSRLLANSLGMDITSGFSVPVSYCEPTTNLSRMAEIFEYSWLLDNAVEKKTPLERLACVAMFVMSGCSNTQRYQKPFNPLLGETYEFVDDTRGIRLFAEQISHHPPISVSHTEHKEFSLWQQAHIKTKFLGNSFELYTNGNANLYLKTHGELYSFAPPVNKVHNMIIGSMWIEYYGESLIENLTTGDKCVLHYEPAGWFGRYSYRASGYCETKNGLKPIHIDGMWSESAEATWTSGHDKAKYLEYLKTEEGKKRNTYPLNELPPTVRASVESFELSPPASVDQAKAKQQAKDAEGDRVCFWAVPPHNFEMPYDMNEYAYHLTDLDHDDDYYCPTDSRLRPDLRTLSSRIMERAIYYKGFMEEEQRKDKRERDAKKDKWIPVWFSPINESTYVYTGDYWEQAAIKRGLVPSTAEERQKAFESEKTHGYAMYYPRYRFTDNPDNLTPEQQAQYAKWRKEKEEKEVKEEKEEVKEKEETEKVEKEEKPVAGVKESAEKVEGEGKEDASKVEE